MTDQATDVERLRILQRHVDHLLSQLYHQVELIEGYRGEVKLLRDQLSKLEECPPKLDQALHRIEELRAAMTGQKEVENDLRRRMDELIAEERVKSAHIQKLTEDLNRIWQSPHRRLYRAMRRMLGSGGHRQDGP